MGREFKGPAGTLEEFLTVGKEGDLLAELFVEPAVTAAVTKTDKSNIVLCKQLTLAKWCKVDFLQGHSYAGYVSTTIGHYTNNDICMYVDGKQAQSVHVNRVA